MSKTVSKYEQLEKIVPEPKHWLTEDEVEDKYKDIELTEVGMKALRLTLGYLMGDINIPKEKMTSFRLLISQFLPSAGTNVNVNVNVRPEEYIAKAMSENMDAYRELVAEAERKALELRDSLDARIIEAEFEDVGIVADKESLDGANEA